MVHAGQSPAGSVSQNMLCSSLFSESRYGSMKLKKDIFTVSAAKILAI